MSDQKFKERYGNLNPEQKKAVDTIEGPVMVIAGPGTGKTEILTLRIANILQKTDTPPSGILALTFTEAGVRVMRQKLRELIGSRESEIRVHTFHGFAASIIHEFDDHFPHLSRAKQITDVEAEGIVRGILKDKKFAKLRPLGDPDFYLSKILKTISESKKEAWSPDILKSFALAEIERIKEDEGSISKTGASKGGLKADALKRIEKCEKTILFVDVYTKYEEEKRLQKKIDFDDLLFELLLALKGDELLLQLLQEKFLYILVDEHQDTNDSQNEIVRLLSSFFETPNVFVVGDEKQAIYRFQGASVENFLRFQNLWKGMEVVSLSGNYRSHQHILDASFRMIEENYKEDNLVKLRVRLVSKNGKEKQPIEIVSSGNVDAGEKYLVDSLREISEKYPEETVAVIVRDNKEVSRILALCEENGVSVSAERGADIFSHPLGGLYFALLQYLSDPSQVESLAETLAGGLWGVSLTQAAMYIKKIRSNEAFPIETEIPHLKKLHEEADRLGVLEYLILAADLSGLTLRFAESPLSSQVWRGIISLAKELAENKQIENPRELMKEMLAYKVSAERKNIKVASGKSDAHIQIVTAHSSKGMEYDYVFLPYATEDSWMKKHKGPSFVLPREKDDEDEVRDARRLFYVALTRARRHVVIISPQGDTLGKEVLPLRFLDELNSQSVSRKEIPVFEKKLEISNRKREIERKTEIIEYAKRMILENGLSVTALNHFAVCPSQFLYKSILKLPEPPTASSEKGNAMHKALDLVWQKKEKRVEKVTKIIEEGVKTYLDTSLLAHFEKEAILEELTLSAPKVALALKDLFETSGEVSSESWMETQFETTYEKKPVTFNLHGKLDLVIETDTKVMIFDYKTRGAMSVNAIKGDTKDSDGSYFRQLVFYKILAEGSSRFSEKQVVPALIFIKPDERGRCLTIELPIVKTDIDHVKKEVSALVQSVWSGDFLTEKCEEKSCEWCGLRQTLR